MTAWNRETNRPLHTRTALACVGLMAIVAGVSWIGASLTAQNGASPGTSGVPYANMPALAPIGVRVDNYLNVPDSAKGPAIEPAKGYRTQKLGEGLFDHFDVPHWTWAQSVRNTSTSSDRPAGLSANPEAQVLR